MSPEYPEIRAAMAYLHSVCDGVQQRDASGYGAADRPAADRLAAINSWTVPQAKLAYSIIIRHRGQLDRGGFDFNAIPRPSEDDITTEESREIRAEVRTIVRNKEKATRRFVALTNATFIVDFPFDAEVKDDLKVSAPARWDSQLRRWEVSSKLQPTQAREFLAFIERRGFRTTTNVNNHLKTLINTPEVAPTTPKQRTLTNLPAKRISIDGNRFLVHFPYDAQLKDTLKAATRARWDMEARVWYVEASVGAVESLVMFAKQHGFAWDPQAKAHVNEASGRFERNKVASRAADAKVRVPGLADDIELRPFQRAGVKFAIDNCHDGKGVIIADEMGLGKTPQALATLVTKDAFPALAVVPANVLINWKAEAKKFFPNLRVKVLKGNESPPATGSIDGGPSYHLYIMSYDNLYKHTVEVVETDFKGKDRIVLAVKGRFQAIGLKGLVLDESHYVKGYKTRRTMAAKAFSNIHSLEVRLLLTGTMIANRPGEAISQLDIIKRLDDVGGFWAVKQLDNMDPRIEATQQELLQFNERLMMSCMARRLKVDVAKELPPKQRSERVVEITNRKEYTHAENDLIGWLNTTYGTAKDPGPAEALVRINALRLVAAKGKLEAAKTWVEDFLESGQKLVLFAHHKIIIEAMAERFPNCVKITGNMSSEERQDSVTAFQNDPNVRLVVASLQAASVGLTLTAASNVAFLEMGWTPAIHDQAEDRVHRIGQEADSVNAWYLLGNDTIDEYMYTLINEKRFVMKAVMDGKLDTERSSILSDLVKKLTKRTK